MSNPLVLLTGAIAALGLTAPMAQAQEDRPAPDAAWYVGVGGGVIASPDYRGASTYRARPIPVLSVRHGDDFAVNGLEASFTAVRAGQWSAGPQGRFRFGQEEEDNRVALRGLGDVGPAVEIGGFVAYSQGPITVKASLAHDVAGGHGGQVATLGAAYGFQLRRASGPPVLISAGPSITWGSEAFNRAYHGVDARQSARSGLATYSPGAGVESVGLSVNLVAPVSRRVTVGAIAGYDRLVGDAADSPGVRERGSRDQATVGVFLTYRLF